MPWKPLQAVQFAICTYPFEATQPDDLPLQIGDQLYIIEQGGAAGDWYRGYLVAFPSLLAGLTSDRGQALDARVFSGIFPRNCVELREVEEEKTDENRVADVKDAAGGKEEEDEVKANERRKSQGRRLSRAPNRKRSVSEVSRKGSPPELVVHDPMPRNPNAPKPLAPVPLLRVGDESGRSSDEPLVDEIASCLREWHDARLHEVVLARGYSQLERVQDLIKRMDTSRKQLMHDVMTTKELEKLREDAVWDLVAGNKMLGEEVIVRNPAEKGRILTAADSVIEMTKLQANMSILDRPPKAPADIHMLYHVLVDVQNLVCEYEQSATLHMYLCIKEAGERARPLSENFAIPVPVPESSGLPPQDQPKTFFVNLSATDVGIGAESSTLYVVFKLIKDEPVRQPIASSTGKGHEHTASVASTATLGKLGSVRGRFGSQKKAVTHNRNLSDAQGRPITSMSSHSDSPISEAALPAGEIKTVKRTVGVGAISIGHLARVQSELQSNVTLWTATTAAYDNSGESDDWDEIIRDLSRNVTSGYTRVGHVKRFEIFATAFADADLESLVRNTPTLLHDVHMTPKLGFSGVPSEKRSDIYLTLSEPVLPRDAYLLHSKFNSVPLSERGHASFRNLQLTLEIRKGNGERIDDCIYTSSNHSGHTAWRTTGIERGESWNQTIRLSIPTEEVPGSHVVMSIADSPNFPFALAWVPLWEAEAFVRDGDHQVALHVYDEYSSSIVNGRGAYLGLTPWHDRSNQDQENAANLSIRTYLCSTEFSQDPNLLGLLNWRDYPKPKLISLLERFSFVPEIEIVKLLSDVFAALFDILNEHSNNENYEDIVFQNFVVILSIARDRRFNLTNVVENFAHTRHHSPRASQCLLRAFHRLLNNPLQADTSRTLRATLKVGDQMLRLILETARNLSDDNSVANNGDNFTKHPDFIEHLQNLFVSLMALMRNPMPVLLGTQTLVIQNFHAWLPELVPLMSAAVIFEIASNLMDACSHARGKTIIYRLILIVNYSHLDIFKQDTVRSALIANTFRWLAPYWGQVDAVTEQWHNQVRLCCSVVAAQMQVMGEDSCQYVPKLVQSYAVLQKEKRVSKKSFSLLFPTTFPFPSRPTSVPCDVDASMLEISALLAAALTTQQRLYFDANQVDITGVLLQALKASQSILTCEAFPKSWLSLHVSHHRFGMSALERICDVLIDSLPDLYNDAADALEFDTMIWRAFFETLFIVVSSPALAMETFPEQKRRAIWKIAGDVRELGANLLRRSWEAIGWDTEEEARALHGFSRMGGYQVQFVPELITPVVELCLSVHGSLRNVAIEVLRSMIISAWEIDQELDVIQTAMIDCLDKLCRKKAVTESMLQKTFIDEMLVQFQPLQRTTEDSLYNAVVEMFGKIEALLNMLATVNQGGNINEATRIVDTLRLMEFLKNVQSDDAYIRYVHKLTDMQSAAGNHTEAGLALRLHADRYDWDPSVRVEEIADLALPAQSAFERKEGLYFDMCQHFEKGQSWQRALEAYRELATQYERNIFDFSKLARAQRAMASIYERVGRGETVSPRYFRVVYRGLGFPHSLRDKDFIFEGSVNDRLATFEDHLRQLHPSAQILRTGMQPDVEGQFLQVYAVSVNKDLNHMVYQRTKVSPAARDYSLLSNPHKFTTTTRHPVHDVPITEQVVEKVVYTTAEPFPTILRRSEVVAREVVTLTSIQAAIERTTRKTLELLAMERRISTDEDEGAMARLSEDLLLSVDPNSESSVARYRTLLPPSPLENAASEEIDPSAFEAETSLDPMQSALKVALLDHTLAIRRCLSLYDRRPAHHATKAELLPRFEASYEYELAILFPNNIGLAEPPPSQRSSRAATDVTEKNTEASIAEASKVSEVEAQDDRASEAPTGRGRRRSLLSLRHGSNSQHASDTAKANGTDTNGGHSQSRQRSRSRLRDTSMSRRLSFFRNNSEEVLQLKSNANAANKTAKEQTHSSMSPAQFKKRLSFLRNPSTTAVGNGD
nr:dedicator of cytokinesis protein 3 [Quercus suber]